MPEPLIDDWVEYLQKIVEEEEQEQIRKIGYGISCIGRYKIDIYMK